MPRRLKGSISVVNKGLIYPERVAAWFECPYRAALTEPENPEADKMFSVIRNVILQAHVELARNIKPSWPLIKYTVERFILKIFKTPNFLVESYNDVKKVIELLQGWYFNIFVPMMYYPGLVNVPVELPLSHGYEFTDTIQLIAFHDTNYSVLEVVPKSQEVNALETSPLLLSRIWGVYMTMDKKLPAAFYRISIANKASLKRFVINNDIIHAGDMVTRLTHYGMYSRGYVVKLPGTTCNTCPVIACGYKYSSGGK